MNILLKMFGGNLFTDEERKIFSSYLLSKSGSGAQQAAVKLCPEKHLLIVPSLHIWRIYPNALSIYFIYSLRIYTIYFYQVSHTHHHNSSQIHPHDPSSFKFSVLLLKDIPWSQICAAHILRCVAVHCSIANHPVTIPLKKSIPLKKKNSLLSGAMQADQPAILEVMEHGWTVGKVTPV